MEGELGKESWVRDQSLTAVGHDGLDDKISGIISAFFTQKITYRPATQTEKTLLRTSSSEDK
jgi:hypothetical protein